MFVLQVWELIEKLPEAIHGQQEKTEPHTVRSILRIGPAYQATVNYAFTQHLFHWLHNQRQHADQFVYWYKVAWCLK